MNKNVIILITVLTVMVVIVGVVLIILNNKEVTINNLSDDPYVIAPSKINKAEVVLNSSKKEELFKFIPKVYTEGTYPFSSSFMLDAVMNKIISSDSDYDFSIENVDNMTLKLFGENAKIDKEEVSTPNVYKSYYYFSKEANSYAVIPVGYEGIFRYQILKNATETENYYYVYTYSLIGGYSYDENSIFRDEYGDINYDNAKVELIVGDKDGMDLVCVFDKYEDMYNDSFWLSNYSNMMPIFRYTLKKEGKGYYLTEVEIINY